MQRHKDKFLDKNYIDTFGNIQSCLRLTDLDEIGDGNHLLYFEMIGLFSFRQWTVKESIDFFYQFINKLNIKIDYVTVHPDKKNWGSLHKYPVKLDEECIWSDGNISGYCTEFYSNGLEIGNIVNPLETCIDVGFGLERLIMCLDPSYTENESNVLQKVVQKMICEGIVPSHNNHGYVLKKLIRRLIRTGAVIEHKFFIEELDKVNKQKEKYLRLKNKHKDKSKEWWWDTHGIEVEDCL